MQYIIVIINCLAALYVQMLLSVCLYGIHDELTKFQQPDHLVGWFWWQNCSLITYWYKSQNFTIGVVGQY